MNATGSATKSLIIAIGRFCSCTLLTLEAGAGWLLLDDYERFEDGTEVSDLYSVVTQSASSPSVRVYSDDVLHPDGNKGLFIDWGLDASAWSDVWVSIPLPLEVQEDTFLSVYFRLFFEGYSNKFHMGATVKKTETQGSGPADYLYVAAWTDHSTIFRIRSGGLFQCYSNGRYNDSTPEFRMALFQWYEFVIVINNASRKAEKNWRLYHRDPGSPDWLPLTCDPAYPVSMFSFRNSDKGAIKAVAISTNNDISAPNNRDFWFIDDLFVDLQNPVVGNARIGESIPVDFETGAIGIPDTWGGIPIRPDGFVDTGPWLGWLNVAQAPWAFSTSLKKWIYAPDPGVDASGVWIYIVK